jgi:hypothetical protein
MPLHDHAWRSALRAKGDVPREPPEASGRRSEELFEHEEAHMRMLMHVHLPLEPFNTAVRDGTAGQKIQQILEAIRPEAVYFSEQHGQRGGILVVDVKEPSSVPALAEPWFLTFEAQVEFRIAMTPEDLARSNLDALGKKWA